MSLVFVVTGLDNQIWMGRTAELDTTASFEPVSDFQVEGPVAVAARDDRHYLCMARTADGGLHLAEVDGSHHLSFSPMAEGSLASSAPALVVFLETIVVAIVGTDQRPYVAYANLPEDLSFSCLLENLSCAVDSSPALAVWKDEVWLALVHEDGTVLLGHGSPDDLVSTLGPVGQVGETQRSVSLVAWDGKLWMAGVDRDEDCWLASSEDGQDFTLTYLTTGWSVGSSPSLGVADDKLVYLVVNSDQEQQMALGDETGSLGEFTPMPSSSTGTACVVELTGLGESDDALQDEIDAAIAVLDDKEKTDAWPEAFQRLKDFADKGDAGARYYVAGYFSSGTGIETDDAQSIRYYRLAADQGHRSAQYLLGLSLIKGWSVEPNKPEGVRYLQLALVHGDADAQGKLEELRKSGEITDADESTHDDESPGEDRDAACNSAEVVLDDENQSEAWTEAFGTLKKLAERGHVKSNFLVGYYLARGTGTDVDRVEAARYFRIAADEGHSHAQYRIGLALFEGDGVTQDKDEGRRYIDLGAAQGDHTAITKLEQIVQDEQSGGGAQEADETSSQCNAAELVLDDSDQSEAWPDAFCTLKNLADEGHVKSLFLVGYYLGRGTGVETDYGEARRYLRLAADQGHANAQYRLGYYLFEGIGVTADDREGKRYLTLAAAQGDESAIHKLAEIEESSANESDGETEDPPVDEAPAEPFVMERADGLTRRIGGYRQGTRPRGVGTYRRHANAVGSLPARVDMRPQLTEVEDQSDTQSCAANAVAGAYEYLVKQHRPGSAYDVSRLFIYFNARTYSGDENEDAGSQISDAIKSLRERGACSESTWNFDVARVNERPHEQAYKEASKFVVEAVETVPTELDAWRHALASGHPIIFGAKLFKSFETQRTKGLVPMPTDREGSRGSHAAHAMLAVGYSDKDKLFIVRNSWGAHWGDGGYCYMPYDYLISDEYNFGDSWIIKQLDDPEVDPSERSNDRASLLPELDTELGKMSEQDYATMIEAMGDIPLETRLALIFLSAAGADGEMSDAEFDAIAVYLSKIQLQIGSTLDSLKVLKHAIDLMGNEPAINESMALLRDHLSSEMLTGIVKTLVDDVVHADGASEDEQRFVDGLAATWNVDIGE